MSGDRDPAIQRRRLRVALRDIRQQLGYKQKEVADALDWSPSKLLRIENGTVTISRSDLLALMGHYDVTDQAKIAELVEMAQVAKRQSWSQYRDALPPEFLTYLGYEGAAYLIRSYQLVLVPGLLQTEEYAEVVVRALASDASEDLIAKRVQARMERQELLSGPDAPEVSFILDEGVVRRRVGPGKVMLRQLQRLREAVENPKIHIQILPFTVGVHPGLIEPFVLLDFADPADDDLLYLERGHYVSREDPDEVLRYNNLFFELEDLATPKEKTAEFLDRAIDQMAGVAGVAGVAGAAATGEVG